MSRYIDADELHEEIFEETKFKRDPETNDAVKRLTMPISEVLRRMNNQPSVDVVEVVRCKDCKYLKPYTSQYGTGQFCECPCSFGGQGIKKPDDYCSYGERRDDREYNNSILNARKGEE